MLIWTLHRLMHRKGLDQCRRQVIRKVSIREGKKKKLKEKVKRKDKGTGQGHGHEFDTTHVCECNILQKKI